MKCQSGARNPRAVEHRRSHCLGTDALFQGEVRHMTTSSKIEVPVPTWDEILNLYNRKLFFAELVHVWRKKQGVDVIRFIYELKRRKLIATWILYAGYAIGTLITMLVLGFALFARDYGSYAQSNPNASAVAVALILLVTFAWGIFYSVGRTLVLRWSAEEKVIPPQANNFAQALQLLCSYAGKNCTQLFDRTEVHIRTFVKEFPAIIAREILEEETKTETIQTLRRRAALKDEFEFIFQTLESLGLAQGSYEPYFALAKQQIAAESPPAPRGSLEFEI